EKINKAIKLALIDFSKKMKAFSDGDAILTGVETRTSCPIRIERNKNYSTLKFKNLRPIGEGAGYAGGIISSALDGLKCAIEILEN
ncbi:MAG: FAD-dependent oxidoreductase, partial [Anaerococcus obesiensis]